ncbi:MAG: cell division protein [Rhodospirillaceae bacterium]|nr:cell division protein [Rhodospirillaceae bacterium]
MAQRNDLPVAQRGSAGRFVAGVVAVLIFISGIAATSAAYVDALLSSWNKSITGTLTVQIAGHAAAAGREADAAIAAARKLAAVARAEIVAPERVRDLLKPWLGDERLIADLPLPILIDIELATATPDAVASVSAAITAAAPGATVDDHRVWLNRVVDFAQGLGTIALALIALSVGALTLTVIFATRASLAEHAPVIEVLHLIGARDSYIANQYAWRSARHVLWGSAIGLVAFAPALGAIGWLARQIDTAILPRVDLPMSYWIGLASLPLLAATIAYIAAQMTVRGSLKAMV